MVERMISADEQKIKEILARSIDKIYPTTDDLYKLLKSGRQLRIFMGIDPTATYVHLGHATNYLLLKRFHDLGHKIVVLIGDFTAMIGDPSDKSSLRRRLTKEEVKNNLKDFKKQIGKILPFGDKDNPIEIVFNSKWLARLTFEDAVELASNFTVQQMIERDTFERRLKENKPLYVHEFLYPLMQGYDSVAVEADVEIGGTDQTFNMLAGRTLLKNYKNKEKIVITTTLLENPVTGEKLMSKSLGTGIALNEEPNDMFGKTMALPDEALIQLFVDCTNLPLTEIDQIKNELAAGANPRDLKMRLAWEIVNLYYNQTRADKAKKYFIDVFQKKELPKEIPVLEVAGGTMLAEVLIREGLLKSKSEFKRLVEEKGLHLGMGDNIAGFDYCLTSDQVIRIGKKKFLKIKIKK